MLKKISELSDGNHYSASNLEQLKEVFTQLQDQIGYETIKGDASTDWLRLGSLLLALAALAALLINRRLPG
jgi:Ca-activated chloride channel family protein